VASQAADKAKDVASTAGDAAGAVAHVAREDARALAGSVREQAGELTDQLSTQGRSLVEDARTQLRTQAAAGTGRMAGTFRELGEQAQALAEGRPEQATSLTDYVWRAADGFYGVADRLHAVAEDVETRGFSGVLDDLQTFARRRPGAFLLGAAAVGFGVGRFVKAQREDADEEEVVAEDVEAYR
jgi:uncharacterized protein YjbJ (UPF0337 family)